MSIRESMKFTILKDKSAMLKELYRRYGNIEELEDVIIGQLDEFIVKEGEDKSLTFVYFLMKSSICTG